MQTRRSVVVNGDLGSGKTTVTTLLAARLHTKRISVGDIYRAMAAQRGVTALQLSLHAELDDSSPFSPDAASAGRRALRNVALNLFVDGDVFKGLEVAPRFAFGRHDPF